MGLFPIYLSTRQVISLLKKDTESDATLSPARSRLGFINVALVTMANGGDNVGTYIPLMTPLSPVHKAVIVCVFMVLVFVWLMTARYLTRHPQAKPLISRYGHIAMPICLFVLGIYILYENGSFALLM